MEQTPGKLPDLEAMNDGFVSVTPLHLDLTHDESLDVLRERFS
jgi:5'-nucleotidase